MAEPKQACVHCGGRATVEICVEHNGILKESKEQVFTQWCDVHFAEARVGLLARHALGEIAGADWWRLDD